MSWPASHVGLISAYLGIEPTAEERIEYSIAQLTAMFVNSNKSKGAAASRTKDFLIFRDMWNKPQVVDPTRYSETDRASLAALDNL